VQVPDIVHSLGAYVEGSMAYVQGPQKGQLYELGLGFAAISVGARFSF
jgi:hypothetical protein